MVGGEREREGEKLELPALTPPPPPPPRSSRQFCPDKGLLLPLLLVGECRTLQLALYVRA